MSIVKSAFSGLKRITQGRYPGTAIVLAGLTLIMIISMLGCPATEPPGPREPRAGLDQEPLHGSALPQSLRKIMDAEVWADMSDKHGFAFGFSRRLTAGHWQNMAAAEELNRGINYAEEGRLPLALKVLRIHYGYYPREINRDRTHSEDLMPERENYLIAYALTRYNRSVVLMKMAEILKDGDAKKLQFHRMALYDLRRSCGAFERLGRGSSSSGGYWGRDVMAWDGVRLNREDSGLPIHHVYANLALAYLRCGSEPGYPQVQVRYMNREYQKYATGQTELSAVTSLLTQACIADGEPSFAKYRLTMALQNLEAAGRGMQSGGEARFHYTIGLILAHLYRMQEGVVPEQAAEFLEQAARGGQDDAGNQIAIAAKRELALMYLAIERDDLFLNVMGELLPNDLRTTGVQRKNIGRDIHFSDVALYGHLRRGSWDLASEYIDFRRGELAGNLATKEQLERWETLCEAVISGSFHSLEDDLQHQWQAGEKPKVIGYLLGMNEEAALKPGTDLGKAYRQVYNRFLLFPRTSLAVLFDRNPHLKWIYWTLPWVLLGLLVFYLYWVWSNHRKWANARLQSGYVEDIHRA